MQGLVPAGPGVPTSTLLALALGVLSLHAALLQFTPARFSLDDPIKTRRFIARGIVLAPLAAAPVFAVAQRPGATTIPLDKPQAAPQSGQPSTVAPKPDARSTVKCLSANPGDVETQVHDSVHPCPFITPDAVRAAASSCVGNLHPAWPLIAVVVQ